MTIYVHENFEPLLEGATDRQKLWLAFWSQIYTTVPCDTWINIHGVDYEFILGLDESLYEFNARGTITGGDNQTARRHLGEAIAADFQWRFENKKNVLWRSRTLMAKHKHGRKKNAWAPKVPTVLTDPKAINCWCYLLGRLQAGNLITEFKWFDQGNYTIDRLQLEAMGTCNR